MWQAIRTEVVYVFDELSSRQVKPDALSRCCEELTLPLKAIETLIALIEMRGEIVCQKRSDEDHLGGYDR